MPKKNSLKNISPLKQKYLSINSNNKKLSEEDIAKVLKNKADSNNINLMKNKKKFTRSRTSKTKIKNLRPGSIKGPWSVEENKLLTEWVLKNGQKRWKQCEEFIPGRTGKQCREHWNNCLNPDLVKGDWTSEEDFLIMYFYSKCNGSWKKLINLFNGRTENSIKNRFFSQLRKIASCNLSSAEKRLSSKIKLDDLLNYLNIGISNSKKRYLAAKPQTEEELNKFLTEMEKKIKNKKNKKTNPVKEEENDINDTILSTNLSNLENNQNILNKKTKKSSLFGLKRKRELDEEVNNKNNSIKNEENSSNKNNEEKYIENNISNTNQNEKQNNNENHLLNNESNKIRINNIFPININENELKEINDNLNNPKWNNYDNEIQNNYDIDINNTDLTNKNEQNNIFTNNCFLNPFSQNYSSFENYLNNFNCYFPQENNFFKRADSFSDLSTRNQVNTYNFIKKPSIASIDENKIINNDIDNALNYSSSV